MLADSSTLCPDNAFIWRERVWWGKRVREGTVFLEDAGLRAMFLEYHSSRFSYPCQEITGPVGAHQDGDGDKRLAAHMSLLYIRTSGKNIFVYESFAGGGSCAN